VHPRQQFVWLSLVFALFPIVGCGSGSVGQTLPPGSQAVVWNPRLEKTLVRVARDQGTRFDKGRSLWIKNGTPVIVVESAIPGPSLSVPNAPLGVIRVRLGGDVSSGTDVLLPAEFIAIAVPSSDSAFLRVMILGFIILVLMALTTSSLEAVISHVRWYWRGRCVVRRHRALDRKLPTKRNVRDSSHDVHSPKHYEWVTWLSKRNEQRTFRRK
jgi:hypothetical protein